MATEGNLQAPTRHPVEWKNPLFYDEADTLKEVLLGDTSAEPAATP